MANTSPSQHISTGALMVVVSVLGIIFSDSSIIGIRADEDVEETMTIDEVVEIVEPFAKGCDQQPEREHIIEMIENREDAKMETKCFRHCLLKQFEVMPEGQMQFDEDNTVDMMNTMFPDKKDHARRITQTCNQENAGALDKCEAAHGISMCMLREMRQAGYKIPEIKQ
ncbi:uncharacterized protein LOC115629305 [Scaptodrosophila lebanonensis]|uniref:Uncharacterized protein LOC115629305 n=1 Tax=Drosophila lebanonensis TaxID=7225 RepID=A0A6J2U133_DROLE|nr:uncharacterized protein LOC115629305 [Scaptodrosophila lebanonensis]